MYDVIIVGAGTAGLSAAIYAGRAGKRVLLLERKAAGGEILRTARVENFPGLPDVSGERFGEILCRQAESIGIRPVADSVTDLRAEDSFLVIGRETYRGKAVIIAAGSRPRTLGIPGEAELTGRGVSYCATCDGPLFRGREVSVIGGGNTAVGEALELSAYCRRVTVLQDLPALTAEKRLCERLETCKNVSVLTDCRAERILGGNGVTGVLVSRKSSGGQSGGETLTVPAAGVFIAVGQKPQNEPFLSLCRTDENGYILADETCMTTAPGVFAAGDCRTKAVRQLVTAASDGAVAALGACRYAQEHPSV